MKLFFQTVLLLLTWFTNLNATPVFLKIVLPSYSLSFSTTENQKKESEVKIGIQNFARSGISEKSDPLNTTLRENYVLEESHAHELYKIVPKGEGVTPFTPFFMTKAEFEALETAANIEQKLGLPLISHSVEYDVYKITATQEAKAFENTIANTLEKTYTTTGGGKQMLVIDRSKWSAPVKVKTIIPNQ